MRRRVAPGWIASVAALALLLAGASAQDGAESRRAESSPTARPVTPEEQFAAIKAEYEDALKAYLVASGKATTPEEKKAAQEEFPEPEMWFPRIRDIVKAHPADPATVKALIWVVNHNAESDAGREALGLLLRDHVASSEIKDVVDGLGRSVSAEAEALLRAVIGGNQPEEVQARAKYALAQVLKQTADLARQLRDASDPEEQENIQKWYAKQVARLVAVDVARNEKEAEGLLEVVKEKHAGVKMRGPAGPPLGERAERDLFEMRNLSIGKVAPEIEGEDIEGKPLKLSDFKGKVVVLDFWGHW